MVLFVVGIEPPHNMGIPKEAMWKNYFFPTILIVLGEKKDCRDFEFIHKKNNHEGATGGKFIFSVGPCGSLWGLTYCGEE